MTEPDVGLDGRHRTIDKAEQRDIKMERLTCSTAGTDVVGNLHKPADFDPDKKYPAIVVTHPFGAVKAQVSTLYAER